jgi:glc operon protein GlcG
LNLPAIRILALSAAILVSGQALAASAPAAPAPEYGPNITLEQAERVMAVAEAEARRINAKVGIAIVEPNGSLTLFKRMTGANYNTIGAAQQKARASAIYKRPTTAWIGREASITSRLDAIASAGGELIIYRGQVIGAIGISGSSAELNMAKMAAASLN